MNKFGIRSSKYEMNVRGGSKMILLPPFFRVINGFKFPLRASYLHHSVSPNFVALRLIRMLCTSPTAAKHVTRLLPP